MEFDKFIRERGRGLPVFLVIDTSGSMQGQKIDTVNVALKEMINSFRKIENPKGIIEICIITFGKDGIGVIKPLSEITEMDNYTLTADGGTPMGAAISKVSSMIEDYNIVSKRSYTPTIVLISDGNPTDYDAANKTCAQILQWDQLVKLHTGVRSSKAIRMAMGIGEDVNNEVLKAFINNPEMPVISAKDNSTISRFFEWVTMTVSIRSVSSNPNEPVVTNPDDYFDKDEAVY